MSERLLLQRLPDNKHGLRALLYAPWQQVLMRCWQTTLLGSGGVGPLEWERLRASRSQAEMEELNSGNYWLHRHTNKLLAPSNRLMVLVAEATNGASFTLLRSAGDLSAWHSDGRLPDSQQESQLCGRDADCGGIDHLWLGISSASGDEILIWHLDTTRLALVPPQPLRLRITR